jgi:hypothetical protein
MPRFLRLWLAAAGAVVLTAVASPAGAYGVTRVGQSDGSVQIYRGVRLRLVGETLWLSSADGRGTLQIVDGACSFTGLLQRCFPAAVTLHQNGVAHRIALDDGTVYINLTRDPQPVRRSAQVLPARSVLVALHTARGTYVSVRGRLDEVRL